MNEARAKLRLDLNLTPSVMLNLSPINKMSNNTASLLRYNFKPIITTILMSLNTSIFTNTIRENFDNVVNDIFNY